MYLANIFINHGSSDEFLIQVWDMDSKQEKIVLYLQDELLLDSKNLNQIIANAIYDQYKFRVVSAIIINPSQMAINEEAFEELMDEAEDKELLFDIMDEKKVKN